MIQITLMFFWLQFHLEGDSELLKRSRPMIRHCKHQNHQETKICSHLSRTRLQVPASQYIGDTILWYPHKNISMADQINNWYKYNYDKNEWERKLSIVIRNLYMSCNKEFGLSFLKSCSHIVYNALLDSWSASLATIKIAYA